MAPALVMLLHILASLSCTVNPYSAFWPLAGVFPLVGVSPTKLIPVGGAPNKEFNK
jgi:hypothetical protein